MDLSLVAKLTSSLLSVPVSVLEDKDIASFASSINPDGLSDAFEEKNLRSFLENAAEGRFYELMDRARVRLFYFIWENSYFLVGPYIRQEFSDDEIAKLCKENGWDARIECILRRKLFELSVAETKEIGKAVSAILQSLGDVFIDGALLVKVRLDKKSEDERILPNQDANIQSIYRRYELENALLDCVRNGTVEEIDEQMRDISKFYEQTYFEHYFSDNPVVAAAMFRTLIRKAAEQSGLSVIVINELLSQYGQLMRKATAISDNYVMLARFARTMTQAVRDHLLHTSGQSPLIRRVCDHIYYHFAEDLSLTDLAEKFKVSPSYLSRRFAKEVRLGFNAYLSYLRLSKAAELLTSSDYSVTEVAMRVGFSDSNYFAKAFRERFGMPPRKYRQEAKQKHAEQH